MSGTPGLSGSARAVIAAQKSAEGIVAGPPAKARTTDRVIRTAGSCGPSGRTSSWNWPWSRRRGVKPGAPETEGPKPVWRVPTPNARRLSSTGSASPPCEAVPQLKSVEPPCTDPYARWCGRGGAVRLPPIPIDVGPRSTVVLSVVQGRQTIRRCLVRSALRHLESPYWPGPAITTGMASPRPERYIWCSDYLIQPRRPGPA